MKYFLVYNTQGTDLGVWEAETGDEAIAAMLKDAGYGPDDEIEYDERVVAKEVSKEKFDTQFDGNM